MIKTMFTTLICAFTMALPIAGSAQSLKAGAMAAKGPRGEMVGGEVTVRVKVIELDTERRLATLKNRQGKIVTVSVPPEMKNFDQVRAGDDVVVRYAMAVAARLEPASTNGIRERIETVREGSAPAGGMPATAASRTVEVVAVVQSIDRKNHTAVLRGATRTVTVAIPPDMDVSKVKVGSEVRAVFVEAVVLDIERVAAK